MKHNAASSEEVRDNARQEKLRLETRRRHWQAVIASDSGQYVLLDLIDWCSTFKTLPVPPDQLQRSAGVQRVGHYILEQIAEIAPERLGALLAAPYVARKREQLEREAKKEQRQKRRNPPEPSGEEDSSEADD